MDLQEREEENPENRIEISDTADNNVILDSLIKEDSDTIDWSKALPMTRYEDKAPPIILDNIEEVEELNVNTSDIQLRDFPSLSDLSVLTSYWDSESGKWLESRRASYPYIAVKMTKINPRNNNSDDSKCTTLCLMADSGAMCSLLNHETIKQMGIDPESLDKSAVSITGINGKN